MEIRRERMAWRSICAFLWLLFSCCFIQQSSALRIKVKDVECLYEYVFYDGDTISGNFVIEDHDMYWNPRDDGIDFTVTAPGGNIVHSSKDTPEDKFELKAPRSGMYSFCFRNPSSTPENVAFHIHVGHIPNQHDLAKDEHLNPINVRIAVLREALEAVTGEQEYLKAREARHRHTNERTRRRVVFYTVLEYVLLVATSGVQVFIIQRLFSKSVGYNRI